MGSVVTIMTGGTTPNEDLFYRDFLESASYRIAADSGLNVLYRLKILPDQYLGDSDSVDYLALDWIDKKNIIRKDFPTDKDYSDTHLAIDVALKKGAKVIQLLGGIGSRLDHSLANLYLAIYCHNNNARLEIIHSKHYIYFLSPESPVEIGFQEGYFLSIIAVTSLESLVIQGCKWNVYSEAVHLGETRCLSNIITENEAKISLQNGRAFVIYAKE